jgi:hypothetical protein
MVVIRVEVDLVVDPRKIPAVADGMNVHINPHGLISREPHLFP